MPHISDEDHTLLCGIVNRITDSMDRTVALSILRPSEQEVQGECVWTHLWDDIAVSHYSASCIRGVAVPILLMRGFTYCPYCGKPITTKQGKEDSTQPETCIHAARDQVTNGYLTICMNCGKTIGQGGRPITTEEDK